MNLKKIFTALILLLICQSAIMAQDSTGVQDIPQDTVKRKFISDNPRPSGIFAAPLFGLSIPVKNLHQNSGSAINYGIRLEYASINIYPIIIGVSFQMQNFKGSDNFKTANLLDDFQTKVTTFGVGADILLNKFLKSNFTLPFFTIEGKYIKVSRTMVPEIAIDDIKLSDSIIGVSAGLGFTIYIFDIYGNYTFAKDYSNIALQLRFHVPVLKF